MSAFLELLERKSLDKITVKDIIETAEINRNTFYYYYENVFDLLDAIFEYEGQEFANGFHENSTFYDEYSRAASIFVNHKTAIFHIYNSKSKDVLQKYLEQAVSLFVERFVRISAEGRNLTEDGVNYITLFYTYAIVGKTLHWIEKGMPYDKNNIMKTISGSFEATIDTMIVDYIEHNQ